MDNFLQLFTPLSYFRPVTTAFEDFELPLDVKESKLLLFGLLGPLALVCTMELSKRFLGEYFRDLPQGYPPLIIQSSSMEGGRKWQLLKDVSAPIVFKVHPRATTVLDKVAEYLKENCCGSFREVQSYATCWALATIFGHCFILDSTLRGRRKAMHCDHSNCS